MATHWVSATGAATWAASISATPLSGAACATLATACSNVAAGDVVYLRAGTYDQGLLLNAKDGTAENKIVFEAYNGEAVTIANTTTAIFAGYYAALMLIASDYIVARGITFLYVTGPYLFNIWRSNYAEIDSCVVDGNGTGVAVNIWKGNSALGDESAATHNWIHHTTFKGNGVVADNNDHGGLQVGMFANPYDHASGNNTIEDCVFYGGGHHNIETFSKRNVLRRNFYYNAGTLLRSDEVATTYGPDTNGNWGNRNIQIYDGSSNDGMFNLLEQNRFGPSGPPPDDDGGDGITLTAPKNILRFNSVYGAQNNGVYFKSGSSSYSDNNRFYNNTIFSSGRFDNTGPLWQGVNFRCAGIYFEHTISSIEGVDGVVTCTVTSDMRMVAGSTVTIASTTAYNGNWTVVSVSPDKRTLTFAKSGTSAAETSGSAKGTGPQVGNVIKNNILYGHGGASDWSLHSTIAGSNTIENNLETTEGDPLFVDDTIDVFPATLVAPNLNFDGASIAVGAGESLTLASSAGNVTTTLVVDDALFFQDGTWGSSLASLEADWIAVGTVDNVAQIASIDYDTNTITLASPLTWTDNAEIWLYKDSSGNQVLFGSAPHIGAGFVSGPLAPSSLSATAISASVIGLGWTNNAIDADGIYVERSSDNSTFTQIASLGSTDTTYSATGLASGTQYWFRVRAYNENGNSASSNTANSTTFGILTPTLSSGLAIGGGEAAFFSFF